MQSLRNDFDNLERSFNATKEYAHSARKEREAAYARQMEARSPIFSNANKSRPTRTNAGDIANPFVGDSTVLTDDLSHIDQRSFPIQTPPRNSVPRPMQTVITPADQASLAESRPDQRSMPLRTTNNSDFSPAREGFNAYSSSTTTPSTRFRTTQATSSHMQTPSRGMPTPSRASVDLNQSYMTTLEPEPVQTPAPSVYTDIETTPVHGLGTMPELRLLDSLLGTVEALKKRLDNQDFRLERIERENLALQEQVEFWKEEASHWREESRREWQRLERLRTEDQRQLQELLAHQQRDEERRALEDQRNAISQVQERRDREWRAVERRTDVGRLAEEQQRQPERRPDNRGRRTAEPAREAASLNHELDGILRSPERPVANRETCRAANTSFRNITSPGERFVHELSERLPLSPDQYEVLSSLMNRYLVDKTPNQGR